MVTNFEKFVFSLLRIEEKKQQVREYRQKKTALPQKLFVYCFWRSCHQSKFIYSKSTYLCNGIVT
jgi:hypothetical protein